MPANSGQQFWNEDAQTTAPAQRRQLQLQLTRLQEAVSIASSAPFFARRLADVGIGVDDIASLEDLQRLPIITKNDLRQSESDYPPLGDYRVHGLARAVRIGMSSGTTGKPTTMLWFHMRAAGATCESLTAGRLT